MRRLELTLSTAAENVALDEALLDSAEEGADDREVLRIWESTLPMVVVGRSSRIAQEVDEAECARRNIAVIRRSSGGAAIVAGPGSLMYAVVLSYTQRPELRDITRAHTFVLDRIAAALSRVLPKPSAITRAGTSDLVLSSGQSKSAARKFSGNSLRVKRTHCLYHGTLLYNFDLAIVTKCLRLPPRRPEYRASRSHADFLQNLPLERQQLVEALHVARPTNGPLTDVPTDRVAQLVRDRFSAQEWNQEFA
jgi:lipoate-protein ligase A